MTPSVIPTLEISGDSVFWHFFQHNRVPMWVFDVESLCFLRANNAALEVYGYSEEEFFEMTIKDIRPCQDIALLEDNIKKNMASFAETGTWRHIKKNGCIIWVSITAFTALFEGKKAKVVTAYDITKNIEQSEALAKANQELEKLSLVAKITGNSVMILNAEREIIWVNHAFTVLSGYSLAEAIGKKPPALLHGPHSSNETTQRIQKAIDEKTPFTEEIVHYSKTGRQHWILADGQPVPGNQIMPAEYIIVETDITELKEKEAAISSSTMQMNTFFAGTASLHILFDTSLNIITYNKVAENFVSNIFKRKLAVGQSMLNIVSQPTQERFLHFAREALKGHATLNREAEIPLDDDTGSVWWIISDIPAYDSFGKIMGVAFTAFDITERKKAEQKIKRQNQTLKEIAWKQSHLVRVPLANILSLTSLLQTNCTDTILLDALKEESKRLDTIITGIVYNVAEQ
jgi:PAS domain S-box-containing protein